jgi:glycosyltransferase involved in cell wall biosynthesis
MEIDQQKLRAVDQAALRIRGDASALPFKTGSLGPVLCIYVLEHLANMHDCIAEVDRTLSDGGRLLVFVPCRRGLPRVFGQLFTLFAFFKKVIVAQFNGVYLPGDDLLARDFVDGYICTSGNNLNRLMRMGIKRRKIQLIPPAVDHDVFRPRDSAKAGWDSSHRESIPVVTFVGNILSERLPPAVLTEMDEILNGNLELRIYTPDATCNRQNALGLRRLLSQLRMRHRIVVRNLSEQEKAMAYNCSDALIFPFEAKANLDSLTHRSLCLKAWHAVESQYRRG